MLQVFFAVRAVFDIVAFFLFALSCWAFQITEASLLEEFLPEGLRRSSSLKAIALSCLWDGCRPGWRRGQRLVGEFFVAFFDFFLHFWSFLDTSYVSWVFFNDLFSILDRFCPILVPFRSHFWFVFQEHQLDFTLDFLPRYGMGWWGYAKLNKV